MDDQNELFIVVDKNDKVLGYRTRYDCHHNKQLIHRAVGIVVYNNKGQILVQKRSKNKDLHPNFYTISASGHVSKGQSYKQAALRELKEELGIKSTLKQEKKFLAEMPQETEIDCLFTTIYEGPFYPNGEEIDEVRFVDRRWLKKMRSKLTPGGILSLQKLGLLS